MNKVIALAVTLLLGLAVLNACHAQATVSTNRSDIKALRRSGRGSPIGTRPNSCFLRATWWVLSARPKTS